MEDLSLKNRVETMSCMFTAKALVEFPEFEQNLTNSEQEILLVLLRSAFTRALEKKKALTGFYD